MKELKDRLLLVGDYSEGTGFSRVVSHLVEAMLPHFEIHHVGIGYQGSYFVNDKGIHIYPEYAESSDPYSIKQIGQLLHDLQPKVYFIVYDIQFIRYFLQALRYKSKPVKTIAYVALDGLILKGRKLISTLKDLDCCVWYTHFAHEQVQELLKKSPSLLHKPVRFERIPHGVETDRFFPIEGAKNVEQLKKGQIMARKKVFPGLKDPENTFIVFNGNRTQPNKRLDITLKAFAGFAKDKPTNVKLYLHNTYLSGMDALNIQRKIAEYSLAGRVLNSVIGKQSDFVNDATLNLVYNACDIGINTCMGEGWGLVSCEHGATGAPQILPRHTAFPEIWGEVPTWIEAHETTRVRYSPHQMYVIDPAGAQAAMEVLYQDEGYRWEKALTTYKHLQQEQFNWRGIGAEWERLLRSVLEGEVKSVTGATA